MQQTITSKDRTPSQQNRRTGRTLFTIALTALVTLGLTFAATSWAHPARNASAAFSGVLFADGPATFLGARALEHVADRLELTDVQREEIRDLVSDRGEEIVSAVRAIKQRRVDLFQSIHQHPPMEVDVREAAAGLGEAQADLALLRADLADQVHQVLTSEQQQELDEMKQNLATLLEIVGEGLTDRLAARLAA